MCNFAGDLHRLGLIKMIEERSNEFHNVVPLQIRFNDVDKFGHVNNTIYFQFPKIRR